MAKKVRQFVPRDPKKKRLVGLASVLVVLISLLVVLWQLGYVQDIFPSAAPCGSDGCGDSGASTDDCNGWDGPDNYCFCTESNCYYNDGYGNTYGTNNGIDFSNVTFNGNQIDDIPNTLLNNSNLQQNSFGGSYTPPDWNVISAPMDVQPMGSGEEVTDPVPPPDFGDEDGSLGNTQTGATTVEKPWYCYRLDFKWLPICKSNTFDSTEAGAASNVPQPANLDSVSADASTPHWWCDLPIHFGCD